MFEMFGGKTVSRKPKNAATRSNNRRKSRGVSAKAPRSKLAPKKSTKRTRRGRKHGGSISKSNASEKKYQEITENVIAEMEENKIKTSSAVADVLNDNYLEGKSPKEKAGILNGIARHVGRNRGINGTSGMILLIAIFIVAYRNDLLGYMSKKLNDFWNSMNILTPAKKPAAAIDPAADQEKLLRSKIVAAEKAVAEKVRQRTTVKENDVVDISNLFAATPALTEEAAVNKIAGIYRVAAAKKLAAAKRNIETENKQYLGESE